MKIVFSTNIDSYNKIDFYGYPQIVPRIGEHIEIPKVHHQDFFNRKLPIRLQVVGVTYKENYIKVELHFDPIDIEQFKDAAKYSMFER